MEIFLTEQCKSLTGSLGRGFGYSIRPYNSKKGKTRFFSKRDSKGVVPPDGHWRFILTCAELAHTSLHIEDIRAAQEEVDAARMEAGLKPIAYALPCRVLDAGDVMYIVNHYDL